MQEIIDSTLNIEPKQQAVSALPRQILPWAIWLIATGFVLFQFQLQLCSGPMVGDLMRSFKVTALGASVLASTYYYVYVLMQIPAGMLIDRFGARKLLSIGGLICTWGCLMFAKSHHLLVAEIGRILMGGGSAFAFVGALYLIGRWFPVSRFAFMMGMSDMLGAVGTLMSSVALAKFVEHFSWRYSMIFAGGFSLLLTLLCWFIVRDKPKSFVEPPEKVSYKEFSHQVKALLCSYEMWMHGIYIGILFAVISVFSGLWGIPLIALQEHVSNVEATFLASMAFAGLGITCPIMGWLYPKITRPRMMMISCALMGAFITTWAIYFPPSMVTEYAVLMFMLGVVTSAYVFNFGVIQEITSPAVRTTANGFINTLCVVTVPILQPIVGYVLHRVSSHQIIAGQEVYSIANYQTALALIPISLIIAAIIAYKIPPKSSAEVIA